MKIDIIIPFYKNYETIKNTILSIEDQDYKDYSVTVVIDGKDTRADATIQSVSNTVKCRVDTRVFDTNMGASAARNHGAKHTSGDILFFLDADCQLCPGVLRDVITTFELVPDIGFVYSNYYSDIEKMTPFYSMEFDPYTLETMNYISTMSPIKRTLFKRINGFDEDRKYFQDWGLFYKASRVSKGYFIGNNHFMFRTIRPTEKSISGIKGTLDEKAREFRDYYGIKDKSIVTTTFGAPLQAIQRAKMLGADYCGPARESNRQIMPPNWNFTNWKATYMVGCYNESLASLTNHLNNCVGKPILHFIGTDVFHMMNNHSRAQLITIKKMFKRSRAKLFVNSKRCQKELKLCGIDAELLFTPIYNMEQYKPKPLPEQFTVAVYVSDSNKMHMFDSTDGFSNVPLLREVATALPMIKFKFFGMNKVYQKKDNIEIVGRIPEEEMPEFINECSMVLRATIHDGFPQLPIQFLLSGREALVSCPDNDLLLCHKLDFEDNLDWEANKEQVINRIMHIKENETNGAFISKKAHLHYSELMSVDTFKKRIYECL